MMSLLKNTTALILMLVALSMLLLGCSENHSSMVAATQEEGSEGAFVYPELTPEFLADGPAPGYRFLTTSPAGANGSTLDDWWTGCDSLSASRWCDTRSNRTVYVGNLVSVRIEGRDLPYSTWITVVTPMSCVPVADCYPHPFQFRGNVEIVWNLEALDLPRDFDYTTIVPWYINDAGEYIQVDYTLDEDDEQLIIRTDHFSRYILGARITA